MQYANINYDLVGYLVELLSGEPFHEYCKEHIFTLLEMTHTSFRLADFNIDDVAISYIYQHGKYEKLPYYQLLHYPAGGLRTSLQDLSHFLIAYMNQGVYNDTRILKAETVEEMHKIQPPGNKYNHFYYGLAWMVEKRIGSTFIGHSGYIPGVRTYMFMRQSDNTGVIYFFNSGRLTILCGFVNIVIQNLLFFKADRL
jgi:CubicO group peptidase (beta-lactamase class C family)